MNVDIRQLLLDLDRLSVQCKALNKDLLSISCRAQKLANPTIKKKGQPVGEE